MVANSGIRSIKHKLTGYEAHKEQARKRQLELSQSGRNIGELPDVIDPVRKDRAEFDFRFFCETYLPIRFYLGWSNDHLRVIDRIQQTVLHGGLLAIAMPRGNGKTTLCEAGCLWAVLYGHHKFVAMIGATAHAATKSLKSIARELDDSDLLLQDFPEVVYPLHCLEGVHQRARGQLYNGQSTEIEWRQNELVFPSIQPSKTWLKRNPEQKKYIRADNFTRASGAVMNISGITGQIRGMKFTCKDRTNIRPTLCLLDDPQTKASARSEQQIEFREGVISADVKGLAGPDKKIAALAAVTVIYPDDLSDRLLNKNKHPEWRGERTKMVYAWPTNQKLWDEYAELWRLGREADGNIKVATEFYRSHWAEMDEGAVIAWPSRKIDDELSAIQNAMNLRLEMNDAFFAEYQNEPIDNTTEDEQLNADAIVSRLNGYKAGEVPDNCTVLTAQIDVHKEALFWMVCAWQPNFSGHIIDYGTEPDQPTRFFSLRNIRKTLAMFNPEGGMESALRAGLERLTQRLMGREWKGLLGESHHIDRCLIDANWAESTNVVYALCHTSPFAANITPAHGHAIGASGKPMTEWKRIPGERRGLNWRTSVKERSVRHVTFDTNFWKSFVANRLRVPIADSGALCLYGKDAHRHRLLADHLTSEFCVKTSGRNRSVDDWKNKPGHDNHWFDGLVGCAVGASMCNVSLSAMGSPNATRKRITLSELQRQRKVFLGK